MNRQIPQISQIIQVGNNTTTTRAMCFSVPRLIYGLTAF